VFGGLEAFCKAHFGNDKAGVAKCTAQLAVGATGLCPGIMYRSFTDPPQYLNARMPAKSFVDAGNLAETCLISGMFRTMPKLTPL
jgi:hypothetical protein